MPCKANDVMEHDFSWIYLLIFLAIPLARIIPRLLAKAGIGSGGMGGGVRDRMGMSSDYMDAVRAEQEKQSRENRNDNYLEKHIQEPKPRVDDKPRVEPKPRVDDKPQTKNNLVLGALNRGSKTFVSLQKNTGLNSDELDAVLGDLEKKGMLKVVKKQGMFGAKTELYPTDKGFQAYYS